MMDFEHNNSYNMLTLFRSTRRIEPHGA